jgi:hypothetical protein
VPELQGIAEARTDLPDAAHPIARAALQFGVERIACQLQVKRRVLQRLGPYDRAAMNAVRRIDHRQAGERAGW